MKPALTAEEWASLPNWPYRGGAAYDLRGKDEPGPLYFPTQHGIAAANLHEQPFGFTWEDVTGLRELAKQYNDEADNYEMTGPAAVWLSTLADRIESLLPPEESDPESTTLTGQLHR